MSKIEHPPLTADDITWLPEDDDDGPVTPAPAQGDEVEQAPTPPPPPDSKEEAAIKRKFNKRLKEIEGKDATRADRTLSEIEMAEDWMATQASDRYLFAEGAGWRRYEKGKWTDGAHYIYQDLAAFVRARVEKTLAARSLNKTSVVKSIIAHVAEHRAAPINTFDADPLLVAFPDGTVMDAATWTRRPATREDRITKTLAAAPSDEPSRLWADFVFEALAHYPEDRRDEIAAYMQEWCGVAMTGSCIDETFLFLWGTLGAGKGTFSETLCAMLGEYGTTVAGERIAGERNEHRQWMAGLAGKRFVLINELPARGRWRSDDLNKLVSGEFIEANLMRQNSFHFRSQAHLLVVANTQPSANAASGIWRRIRQVEFRHKPQEVNTRLKEELLDDLPGIVAWALEGLRRWVERGHLPEAPQAIREGVERYANASDPVAEFVSEHTSPSPGNRIEVNTLFAAYVAAFKAENGIDAEVFPKQRGFARRLTDLWGSPQKSNGKTYRASRMLDEIEDKEDNLVLLPGVSQVPSDRQCLT